VSTLSSIGAASSVAFQQADTTLQRAATAMASVSSGTGDVASGSVDLTKARTDVQLGVRVVNTESKMQKALLDIFA
jgi:hypothetical protein